MTVSELLRATAENIRRGGFSPVPHGAPPGTSPNCFAGHMPWESHTAHIALSILARVVGDTTMYTVTLEERLESLGWEEGATDDAAAACEIAADLAEPTPRHYIEITV